MSTVRNLFIAFVLSFVVFFPLSRLEAQTMHVLLVAMTNDQNVGRGVGVDQSNLEMLFRALVPRNQLDLVMLSANDVSWEKIIGTLQRFQARQSDAMVFLYTGHGAYDQRGHHFQMPDGDRLYRATVVREVARRGARLDAVLSSACNVFSPLMAAPALAPPAVTGVAPVFDELFFRSQGLVDINGSSEGEYGFANSSTGTTFFFPLFSFWLTNNSRRMTWNTFVQEMRPRVQDDFRRLFPDGYTDSSGRTQTTQSLRVYHLPPGWPENVRGERRLTYLEQNDVILSINGQRIRSENDFRNAVQGSPTEMVFSIRNSRDGRKMHLKATLRSGGTRFGVEAGDNGGDGVIVQRIYNGYPASRLEIMD